MTKKGFFKIVFFTCLISVFCFMFFGCSSASFKTKIYNSLSETRQNFFTGQGTNCFVTFTTGQRETEYIMNGKRTEPVDYGVLVLKFNYNLGNDLPQFELAINEDIFAGEAERNPYDGTYVFDTERQASESSVIRLYLIDSDEYIELGCLSSSWQISCDKAIEIFSKNFNTQLEAIALENSLDGEIYVKIVSDSDDLEGISWYVLLVCANGELYSCLIDVQTGEILQK